MTGENRQACIAQEPPRRVSVFHAWMVSQPSVKGGALRWGVSASCGIAEAGARFLLGENLGEPDL